MAVLQVLEKEEEYCEWCKNTYIIGDYHPREVRMHICPKCKK